MLAFFPLRQLLEHISKRGDAIRRTRNSQLGSTKSSRMDDARWRALLCSTMVGLCLYDSTTWCCGRRRMAGRIPFAWHGCALRLFPYIDKPERPSAACEKTAWMEEWVGSFCVNERTSGFGLPGEPVMKRFSQQGRGDNVNYEWYNFWIRVNAWKTNEIGGSVVPHWLF